jgi:3-dehydroquinate synthetase/shikimate kinase
MGASPADILTTAGESVLRRAEAEVLNELDVAGPAVVALGGGTLTHAAARVRELGPVVGLDAEPEVLWSRIASAEPPRPLSPSPAALESLVREREATYRVADVCVRADEALDRVLAQLQTQGDELGVVMADVGGHPSRVLVGRGLMASLEASLRVLAPERPVLFIEDLGVPTERRDAYADRIPVPSVRVPVPGGEPIKTWSVLGQVLETALEAGCGRQSVVVALGGGATCDLAGCVAGLLARGAPLVLLPSTLLAQVDASVGGKCAVNATGGKNLIGLFHPAQDVIIDLDLLDSLPEDELRSGRAELFKMAVLAGGALWDDLGHSLTPTQVRAAVAAKADVVRADPFEGGRRRILNLGHTFGHALESALGLRHGDAVSMGLAAMVRWSAARASMPTHEAKRILDRQRYLGLPTDIPASAWSAALPYLTRDKKGSTTEGWVVCPRKVGEVDLVRVQWAQLARELRDAEKCT